MHAHVATTGCHVAGPLFRTAVLGRLSQVPRLGVVGAV